MLGVDYAFGFPGADVIQNNGYGFVGRYLSNNAAKNLSAHEVSELQNAGIKIIVVWETTENRTLAGFDAGVTDAHIAQIQSSALGIPQDRPIYFAVDTDASDLQLNGSILEYFKGINSVIGVGRTGVYGGYATVNALFNSEVCTFFWQTLAWSHGKVHQKTNVYQFNTGTNMLGGVDCDLNRALTDDFGQW